MALLDEAGWSELRGRLGGIVLRICPDWLSAEADDLVQAALLRVHGVVRPEGKPELGPSYLWRVAHSVLVDEIRRRRQRREVNLEESKVDPVMARTENPEVHSTSRELGRAIRRCLGKLIAPRRRAVTLYLLGHSGPETSRLLGWSPKRTENLTYRGLGDLRECLRGEGRDRGPD